LLVDKTWYNYFIAVDQERKPSLPAIPDAEIRSPHAFTPVQRFKTNGITILAGPGHMSKQTIERLREEEKTLSSKASGK
jgi:hypothetical protein